ncbi:hypothetical protein [Micromonospora sp. NPDC049679]|uniref:hypothetical protein n=1 Tax=Micromonospora sp. NPDC049679 TaxID=3155920 RepID=UPI00340E9259
MQRARRLVSIPVIAAVGLLALAGCRSEPGVAAYIGDTKITEDRVTAIVDDATTQLGENAEAQPPTRAMVVSTLVLREVCDRLNPVPPAGQPTPPPVSPEQLSQNLGVPPTTTLAKESAELQTCLMRIQAGPPIAPSAEQLADVVTRGKAAGAIPPDFPADQAAAQLDGEQLRSALASRKAISEAVDRYHVTVNPRYRPLEFPVLRFQGNVTAVGVPIGEAASDAVIDRR